MPNDIARLAIAPLHRFQDREHRRMLRSQDELPRPFIRPGSQPFDQRIRAECDARLTNGGRLD